MFGNKNVTSLHNVFILGDSYSTYEGYIPAGYDPCYGDNIENGTDVRQVEQTWWHQLITTTNSKLIANHSWSGTTICNTGYDGSNTPHSFIRRFDKLVKEGFFQKYQIDTVLVMGGQNDDWSGAPIGELKTQDWTADDLLQYGPALCYLMYRLKMVLPKARIIFIINSEMSDVIMDYQKKSAEIYDIEYIQLEAIHKMNGHPTIQGMGQIADRIAQYFTQHQYCSE